VVQKFKISRNRQDIPAKPECLSNEEISVICPTVFAGSRLYWHGEERHPLYEKSELAYVIPSSYNTGQGPIRHSDDISSRPGRRAEIKPTTKIFNSDRHFHFRRVQHFS
jgi:hypothetical protein